MQRTERSNNEDEILTYASYLAEAIINNQDKLDGSLEGVNELFNKKHLITDLSDLIEWLDEEM